MRGDAHSDSLLKHLAICLVIAVVFYAAGFGWMQHRRTFKGPWQVTFRADGSSTPSLLISQCYLNISETVLFPGQSVPRTNFTSTLLFGATPPELPFGELIFQDPIYLPGTVTLKMFGHQVEILPRVLTIDKKEYPWQPQGVVEVK